MAAGDLVDLATVKEWLGVDDTAQDAVLGRLITVASTAIQNSLNRPSLAPKTYAERLDGTGTGTVPVTNYPIISVTSLLVDGVPIPVADGPLGAGFRWDNHCIFLNGRGQRFPYGRGLIDVVYTAGQPIPPDVEQACLLTVQAMWSSMDIDPNLASESSGGGSFSYRETPGAIPAAAKALLAQHRRVF